MDADKRLPVPVPELHILEDNGVTGTNAAVRLITGPVPYRETNANPVYSLTRTKAENLPVAPEELSSTGRPSFVMDKGTRL